MFGDGNRVSHRSLVAVVSAVLLGVFATAALASPRSSQYDNPATKEPVTSDVLGTKTTVAKVASKPAGRPAARRRSRRVAVRSRSRA